MPTRESLKRLTTQGGPYVLSVLRIVLALLFVEYGSMKLFGFPPSAQTSHLDLISLGGLAALMEFFGGLLLLAGLFTRTTAFLLSGEMGAAYFIAHAPRSFFPALNMGEAAVIYCFLFLYLAFAGPGPWSFDGALEDKTRREPKFQMPSGDLGRAAPR